MQLRIQLLELEHRAAKTPELLFEQGCVHRPFLRDLELQLRVHAHRRSLLHIRPEGRKQSPGMAYGPHMHREYPIRLLRLVRLTQPFIQRRIARFPDTIAYMHTPQIHIIPARHDVDDPTFPGLALLLHPLATPIVYAPAFLLFRRVPGIKHNPVSPLQRSLQLTYHAIAQYLLYTPKINTPAFRKCSLHELLVVRPLQEAMRKPTRKALLQLANFLLGRPRIISIKIQINRFTVLAHHVGHILRTLHSTLDFKRSHARFNQLRHNIDGRQILR